VRITRRQFIKYITAAGAALGLTQAEILKFTEVIAKTGGPKVVWVHGQECTGCSTSVLGLVDRDSKILAEPDTIDEVLLEIIDLQYHETIMAAGGDLAVSHLKSFMASAAFNTFVLVVEGAIPVNGPGCIGKRACSIGQHTDDVDELWFADVVRSLASNSIIAAGNGSQADPYFHAVIAVGTCASFGGVPAASSNYLYLKTGAIPVQTFLSGVYRDGYNVYHKYLVVNVPGCPPNPDWFYGTVVRALGTLGIPGLPALNLDTLAREKTYYGVPVHAYCPLRTDYDAGVYATKRGGNGCLQMLGCKGLSAFSDCGTRGWNDSKVIHGKAVSCITAGHPCMGCTEKGFPGKCEPFMKY